MNRICHYGAKAKLLRMSGWYGKPREYTFRCEKGHTFILNDTKEALGPSEDMNVPYYSWPMSLIETFPKSFSGSNQWVES